MERHLQYGITYLPLDTSKCDPATARQARTRFTYPEWTKGWVSLSTSYIPIWHDCCVRKQSPIQLVTTWLPPDRESIKRTRDGKFNFLAVKACSIQSDVSEL